MTQKGPQLMSRRALLRRAGAAAAAGAAAGTGVAGAAETPAETAATTPAAPAPGASQAPAPEPPRAAYEQLTAEEADLLEAIADQLIPSDELGPGAVAAGAVVYIDRALGGALSGSRDAYRAGLAAFDRYCRASRGAPFRELPHVDQVSALIDVETGAATGARTGFAGSSAAFFNMVRGHVLQGTFGDPYYGGNRDHMDRALRELRDLGARFLVSGRAWEGEYRGLGDVRVPAEFADLLEEIPESGFRLDVSSTRLREEGKT